MKKLRISFLSAVVVPIATSFSCGGSDNPPAASSGTGGGSSSAGGSSSGTGGSTMGMSGNAGIMGMGATPGGGGMRLPGLTPVDGGYQVKGCCDKTGVCGAAFQFGGFSNCITAAEAQGFQGMGRGGGRDGGTPAGDGGFTQPPNETIVSDPSCPPFTFQLMGGGMGMMGGFGADAGPPKACTYKAP